MKVVPSFVYLGVLLHWFLSAIAAGKDRDHYRIKGLWIHLRFIKQGPILTVLSNPGNCREYSRRCVPARRGAMGRFCFAFFSLGSTRILRVASRIRVETACRPAIGLAGTQRPGSTGDCACGTLHDAQRHGGLLALAISQRHYNRESSRSSDTWYGALLREIRAVWPRFSLISSSPVQWKDAPPVDSVDNTQVRDFRLRYGNRDGSTDRFPFFLCVPRSLGRTIFCTIFFYILVGTNSAGSMRMVETLIDLFSFQALSSALSHRSVPEHFGGYCVLWPV